jgi:hypothetical protein
LDQKKPFNPTPITPTPSNSMISLRERSSLKIRRLLMWSDLISDSSVIGPDIIDATIDPYCVSGYDLLLSFLKSKSLNPMNQNAGH